MALKPFLRRLAAGVATPSQQPGIFGGFEAGLGGALQQGTADQSLRAAQAKALIEQQLQQREVGAKELSALADYTSATGKQPANVEEVNFLMKPVAQGGLGLGQAEALGRVYPQRGVEAFTPPTIQTPIAGPLQEGQARPSVTSKYPFPPGIEGPDAQKKYLEELGTKTANPNAGNQGGELGYLVAHPEAMPTYQKMHPTSTPGDISWMSGLVKTTRGGKQFFDASELSGKDKGAGIKWATQQGLSVAGPNEIGQLQDVDAARGNVEDIKGYVNGLLPQDAQSRARGYAGIQLSRILQTNDQRAAFGAYRAAAIRNLRAMAGSKGLRINQAEINLAIKNDIPNITDTHGVAMQKLAIVGQMLDNAENPILSKDWGKGGKKSAPGQSGDPVGDYVNSLGLGK